MAVRIINSPDEVMRYRDDIVALASAQPKALGFPRRAAYEGAIFRKLMHAALLRRNGKEVFAGHIWLGGRWPAKTVVQVAVCAEYQRKGIGGELLRNAINHAKNDGFRTISAKVGKSLLANHFWEKQGFDLVETVRGKSTHPDCNIWEKALVSHSLISLPHADGAVLKRIINNAKTEFSVIPDTNVFINAHNGVKEALSIFRRGARGDIHIMRTSATTRELRNYRGDNGVLKFALQIPEANASGDDAVIEELREIVFSAKPRMKKQDASDLKSLAIAVSAGVSAFVTEDKEILRKAPEIHAKFSLEVLHPGALWSEMLLDEESAETAQKPLAITAEGGFRIVTSPSKAALKKAGFIGVATGNGESLCTALQSGDDVLGVISLEPQTKLHTRKAALYVKPGDEGEYVADTLLGWLHKKITGIRRQNAGVFLKVELTPYKGVNAARNALLSHGYAASPSDKIYRKMHANQVVIIRDWKKFRSDLSRLCGIQLPAEIPDFCRYNQPVQIDADSTVPLNKLEDYLSSIFILPGRGGEIIPIRRNFAESFFDHSEQRRFFHDSAELLGHKSYLRSTSAKARLRVGTPLLFYQSAEGVVPGQIVAVARIVRTQVIEKDSLSDAKIRHLVLTPEDIKKLKNPSLEIVFDNCVILPAPVTLKELRRMRCYKQGNFTTVTRAEYGKMYKILKKGLVA